MEYIIITVGSLIVLLLVGCWFLSNRIVKPRRIQYEKLFQREIDKRGLKKEWYDNLVKKEFFLRSRYGYSISCMMLNNKKDEKEEKPVSKKQIAILCHGYTCSKYQSLLYAKMFLKRGLSVLIYDHRNHGLSGKTYTSMGYYEKFDLQTIVDWCYETYDNQVAIVTHGESMGAATVLSHLSIDGRVRAVIADCAYDSLVHLAKYQLKRFYHLPVIPFAVIANFFIKLRAGFSVYDVVPMDGGSKTNAPVLFIHGDEDKYIPASMSVRMYEEKKDKKDLYIAPNAGHAESYIKNEKEYEKRVNRFLDEYFFL